MKRKKDEMNKEWKMVRLGEVCEKASSSISLNKMIDNVGDYPLFGANGLAKNIDFYHQDKEYIAIVKDGAGVGRVMLLPSKSSVVGTMQYILPKDNVDICYLSYFLKQINLARYASGATIPHIYFKDYSKEIIFLPSIEKQQQIAATLDKASELIQKRKAQLAELDALAESIFYDIFGDPVANEKGWEIKWLREISLKIFAGGDAPTEYSENCTSKYNIPIYANAKKDNGLYGYTNISKVTEPAITIAARGSGTGFVAERNKSFFPIVRLIVVIPNLKMTVLKYLYYAIDIIGVKRNGCAIPQLTIPMMNNYEVPLPPLSLQQQFAERIEKIEQQKQKVKAALKESQDLFQRLMQDMFNPEYHNS